MVIDAFGSSEAIGLGRAVRRRGRVGEASVFEMPDTTRVIDDEGRDVVPGSGTVGRVAARGRIPLGYYADPEARLANSQTVEWIHPVGEVHGALRDAGLIVERLSEHVEVPWQIFPITVPKGDGMFGWPAEPWLPLSYEIVATRDAPGR